jgi:hypothetical protein
MTGSLRSKPNGALSTYYYHTGQSREKPFSRCAAGGFVANKKTGIGPHVSRCRHDVAPSRH